jgi:hypothetical protein
MGIEPTSELWEVCQTKEPAEYRGSPETGKDLGFCSSSSCTVLARLVWFFDKHRYVRVALGYHSPETSPVPASR